MSDYHGPEPVRGLPERLPPGETILWQGAPDWRRLARQAFHWRLAVAYFAVLIGWTIATGLYDGDPTWVTVAEATWYLLLTVITAGILLLLGTASARATCYTITNRRVVMRIGVALPLHVNVPFKDVREALANVDRTGAGDVALRLGRKFKPGYFVLWPHARPWELRRTQPMLRALPDAATCAEVLSEALRTAALERTMEVQEEAAARAAEAEAEAGGATAAPVRAARTAADRRTPVVAAG